MAVIDFGKLQIRNNAESNEAPVKPEFITKESEEDGKMNYLRSDGLLSLLKKMYNFCMLNLY